MSNWTLAIVVLATAMMSAAYLGLGFWTGWIVRADGHGRTQKRPVRVRYRVRPWLHGAMGSLARDAAHVSGLVERHQPPVRDELAAALADVVASINAIEGRLAKGSHSKRRTETGRSSEQHLEDTIDESSAPPSRPLQRGAKRYSAIQHIAPWSGGQMPDSKSFRTVHCHGLSTDELVYFTDEAPPSDQVVVRLRGDDAEIMLVADVVGHRKTLFEDRWRSRVECRFTKRLETSALPGIRGGGRDLSEHACKASGSD
jgi:hypothetical protein